MSLPTSDLFYWVLLKPILMMRYVIVLLNGQNKIRVYVIANDIRRPPLRYHEASSQFGLHINDSFLLKQHKCIQHNAIY